MPEIDAYYDVLGGPTGALGPPNGSEKWTPDGFGRYRHYEHGSIYWTPQTGAHEVHGAIEAKWSSLGWERSVLGYPITDETATPDGIGRFNHFQLGSIYWTPQTGAYELHGAIRELWVHLGSERSSLGYPTSDETEIEHKGGQHNTFQHGTIFWDEHRGAYEVLKRPQFSKPDPAIGGVWKKADFDAGITGLHSALLPSAPNGSIWFLSYHDPTGHGHHSPQPAHEGESRVLDLNSDPPTVTTPSHSGAHLPNLFCGGQAFLGDGRLLMVGGDRETPERLQMLHTFTPGGANGGTWRREDSMVAGRWYPTAVTLPDGRVLTIAGDTRKPAGTLNSTYEIFDPANERVEAPVPAPLSGFGEFATYPFVFVLPNHKLMAHGGMRTVFLDLDTFAFDDHQVNAAERPDRNGRTYPLEGTSVLLPLLPDATPAYRPRVMIIGGGGGPGDVGMRTPATASCEVLDLGADPPGWVQAASMAAERVMPDAVLLPDGTVLVMSGSSRGFADNGANPVWESELYDPSTGLWTSMDHTGVPRLYHATALLLPDATVMTSGTDATWNPGNIPESIKDLEVFEPPYLHTGEDRPKITAAPQHLRYGTTFTVSTPAASSITDVALMRNGSCTHSFNSDQRHVGLEIVETDRDALTLAAPPDGFVAPPGWYMLFLLREGVPCERAVFVHVHS